MNDDCLFCRIVRGELPSSRVHEDEHCVVFRDISPKADVHVLVVPREHIVSLDDITEKHDLVMAHMLRLLPRLAKQLGLPTGFRTIINTGHGGGQVVFHLHIHLMGGKHMPGFA